MGVYIGVNDIAKKVKNIYIGVNNIARKVKSGYIGINNIAHSFLTSGSGIDTTKTEYTEAEINALAAYGEINQIPINSIVTIGNGEDTNRTIKTYRVIGKDHQDKNIENHGSSGTVEAGTAPSIGTVDLWATGAITSRQFKTTEAYGRYNNSNIRTWLNGDYRLRFNTVTQTHMKTMVIEYYYITSDGDSTKMVSKGNYTTNDKVKLLSAKEFNCSSFDPSRMNQREGNGYEYFPSVTYYNNETKRYASETGTIYDSPQWCRSLFCYSGFKGNYPYAVFFLGKINNKIGNDTGTVVPCFRLGAA